MKPETVSPRLSDHWGWVQIREAEVELEKIKRRHRSEVQRLRGVFNLPDADGKQLGAAANAVAAIIKVEKALKKNCIPQRTPILARDQAACLILQPLWDAQARRAEIETPQRSKGGISNV